MAMPYSLWSYAPSIAAPAPPAAPPAPAGGGMMPGFPPGFSYAGGGGGSFGGGMGMGGIGMGGMGMPFGVGVPSILPSSAYVCPHSGLNLYYTPYGPLEAPLDASSYAYSPQIVNPAEAMRDYTELVLSGDRRGMCSDADKRKFEAWITNDEFRAAILAVISSRLELGWPYNYKALDLLALMPIKELMAVAERVQKVSDSPADAEGAAHLKAAAKPLLEKAAKEKTRVEEEEANKRMKEVADMWGQLWCNMPNQQLAQQAVLTQPASQGGPGMWPAYQYPYRHVAPGVAAPAAPAPAGWDSRAPQGWTPSKLTPMPQVYPFSRTGYHALDPKAPPEKKSDGEKVWVSVGVEPEPGAAAARVIPVDLEALKAEKEKERAGRGYFNMSGGTVG